jgi:hypothetical protein
MSIEVEAQRAETSGIRVTKERLIALLKVSTAKQFAVCSGRRHDYVVIKLEKVR